MYFDEGQYCGRLINVFANDSDNPAEKVEIDFLRYSCGYWDFLEKKDIKMIDAKYVFYGSCMPSHTCSPGYKFDDDEEGTCIVQKISKTNAHSSA